MSWGSRVAASTASRPSASTRLPSGRGRGTSPSCISSTPASAGCYGWATVGPRGPAALSWVRKSAKVCARIRFVGHVALVHRRGGAVGASGGARARPLPHRQASQRVGRARSPGCVKANKIAPLDKDGAALIGIAEPHFSQIVSTSPDGITTRPSRSHVSHSSSRARPRFSLSGASADSTGMQSSASGTALRGFLQHHSPRDRAPARSMASSLPLLPPSPQPSPARESPITWCSCSRAPHGRSQETQCVGSHNRESESMRSPPRSRVNEM